MAWVAGVDGCRAGWVVVLVETSPAGAQSPHVKLRERFDEILALSPEPAILAVDIPIGLLDGTQAMARECDRLVRKKLAARACCVFNPPTRGLLQSVNYEEVRSHGMSKQTFGIMPKIREVDRFMTPKRQDTVFESHPELAFRSLAGEPMKFNKKTSKGREERLRTLDNLFPGISREWKNSLQAFSRREIAPDDLLDAYVLAWTALCIAEKKAQRVPAEPPIDSRGLRMEIWY